MRTLRISAGFPAMPPRNPDVEAIAIKAGNEGFDLAVVNVSFSSS